jgi:hypothetical protein
VPSLRTYSDHWIDKHARLREQSGNCRSDDGVSLVTFVIFCVSPTPIRVKLGAVAPGLYHARPADDCIETIPAATLKTYPTNLTALPE